MEISWSPVGKSAWLFSNYCCSRRKMTMQTAFCKQPHAGEVQEHNLRRARARGPFFKPKPSLLIGNCQHASTPAKSADPESCYTCRHPQVPTLEQRRIRGGTSLLQLHGKTEGFWLNMMTQYHQHRLQHTGSHLSTSLTQTKAKHGQMGASNARRGATGNM